MGYRTLRECLRDLERIGQLLRIEEEIDPYLEMAAIHRRVYRAGGPALYFARPKGCRFPMVSNLFGTMARVRYIFRDTLEAVRKLVEAKAEPEQVLRRPWRYLGVPRTLWRSRPKFIRHAPVCRRQTTISQLPHLTCWPKDGGAFITLPQVYTEDPERPGWQHSNLGMYRVQLSGGEYEPDSEVGLHYQIHRSIGVHHTIAREAGVPLRVNVFVGGPPAMTLAAVMPLPESVPELLFAGALAGQRIRMARDKRINHGLPISADADFVITGTVDPQKLLPEGPFGDHLGYYSLAHPFPVLRVERVYHRPDAVWPFTVVGRPPQEDTQFGAIIHEITGPMIPKVLPGVHAVHAVDAAGVHPLLLALGSERYTPYQDRTEPQELLTQANAILGQGQLSLAKYLLVLARQDVPELDIHNISAFFQELLRRVDWTRDLHFQTCTTIDTLDYSGRGLNRGSKVVIAAVGRPRRDLAIEIPAAFHLPPGFDHPRLCLPGVLAIQAPPYRPPGSRRRKFDAESFCAFYQPNDPINRFPLVILADDSDFIARSLDNFLWVTFTRSDPAADVHGIGAFVRDKHWGCEGSLVIDARIKPHHAPPLEEDVEVEKRVDRLAARGGPLHGII